MITGILVFEWDERKNRSNRKKHGVWFEEAQQVFDDTWALRYLDAEHSTKTEDRYLLFGMSSSMRILAVSFCERDQNIRLISARKATRQEKKVYEEGIRS